jgi:hypothetical protein
VEVDFAFLVRQGHFSRICPGWGTADRIVIPVKDRVVSRAEVAHL